MGDFSLDPFGSLPIETTQHIAAYLDSDTDLCNFRLLCHATDDAVNADGLSFWRLRFLSQFEKPAWKASGKKLIDNQVYKDQYQLRKRVLKNGARFKAGESGKEKVCLQVLKDLMLEMYSGKKTTDDKFTYNPINLEHIIKFTGSTNIVNCMLSRCTVPPGGRHSKGSYSPATTFLYAIQVMLAPAMLSANPAIKHDGFAFPDSQRSVYGTKLDYPIFHGINGLDVNMEWACHQINFWKFHMMRKEECTLHPAFQALEEFERPHFWSEQLRQCSAQSTGKKLGKYWKGSYAYIERDDMKFVREGRNEDGEIQDVFNGETNNQAFQDLRLDFSDGAPHAIAPPMFEDLLGSFHEPESRARTRAQKRGAQPDEHTWSKPQSFRFDGTGQDESENFLASGYLNQLPPQEGIPGWQRMTMMKYFTDDNGQLDTESLWCYEGVVLPGGKIMFGRWWYPYDGTGPDMYSGPFLMWAVDAPEMDEDEEVDEVDEAVIGNTAKKGLKK